MLHIPTPDYWFWFGDFSRLYTSTYASHPLMNVGHCYPLTCPFLVYFDFYPFPLNTQCLLWWHLNYWKIASSLQDSQNAWKSLNWLQIHIQSLYYWNTLLIIYRAFGEKGDFPVTVLKLFYHSVGLGIFSVNSYSMYRTKWKEETIKMCLFGTFMRHLVYQSDNLNMKINWNRQIQLEMLLITHW